MTATRVCYLCLVAGKVQGVWYRASTKRVADRLGLEGHAHNLADGRVEVLACGETGAVNELREWLLKGPPASRVDEVRCERLAGAPLEQGFTTG